VSFGLERLVGDLGGHGLELAQVLLFPQLLEVLQQPPGLGHLGRGGAQATLNHLPGHLQPRLQRVQPLLGLITWEAQDVRCLRLELRNPVSALSYSPDGRWLAVGTGWYPLSSSGVQAWVHLFELPLESEEDCPAESMLLPGCHVDCLAWDDSSGNLLAVTGFPDQQWGLAVRLSVPDLQPLLFDPLEGTGVRRACGVELWEDRQEGAYALAYGDRIVGAPSSGLDAFGLVRAGWTHRVQDGFLPSVAEARRMGSLLKPGGWLTSDGWLLDWRGVRCGRVEALPGCVAVAEAWDGCIGLANDGRLRYWPLPSAAVPV
jgi:hypothetical protein